MFRILIKVNIIKHLLGVKLAVICDNEISEFFTTDTGIPQGGGYSANEFTFYLANSLADDHNDHNYAMQSAHDVEI